MTSMTRMSVSRSTTRSGLWVSQPRRRVTDRQLHAETAVSTSSKHAISRANWLRKTTGPIQRTKRGGELSRMDAPVVTLTEAGGTLMCILELTRLITVPKDGGISGLFDYGVAEFS